MIKAIAIDDEPLALKVLENFCAKADFLSLQRTFTRPNEALVYLDENTVDLLFLDINMPSMNGIELHKKLKQQTMVIFTTAHSKYAVDGFNLNAVDFLLKPYTFERFSQAANKAKEYHQYQNQKGAPADGCIFIKADYSVIKIGLAEILYIEGYDDYLKIHLENKKTVVARMTMKGILEKLPEKDFMRAHRSFIVPFKRVESVRNKMVHIAGREIPIGNSYEKSFLGLFKG